MTVEMMPDDCAGMIAWRFHSVDPGARKSSESKSASAAGLST